MAKYSYGPTNRLRVRQLLAAILEFVETGEPAKEVHVLWLDTESPELRVEAKRRFFEQLTRKGEGDPLTADQVRYALSHYLPDHLGILEDERATTRGSEEWKFKLMLWSREPAENLSRFDKLWEERRPEKSKSMASQDSLSAADLAADLAAEKPPHCFISYRSQDPVLDDNSIGGCSTFPGGSCRESVAWIVRQT